VQALADAHLASSPWCEGHLLRALIARLPAGEALLCANSLPIRQLDSWSGSRAARLGLFCNRGVSGIDGQLSTLAGLSHGGRPTWALLGDLSFCHDLSGLLQASRLDRPVLVLNNGGGRIFDYLPQHGLPGFEALWRTPVAPNLAALAAPFGLAHRSISDATGLEQALDDALGRGRVAELIEVRIDADQSRAVHEGFWRRVANAPIIEGG
jgi:2-succinyl-5-enolpyruvyl-6-hydroxy-3-cyclohexene-1-carboxylate synthase